MSLALILIVVGVVLLVLGVAPLVGLIFVDLLSTR
jgi:hypothetical protein